MFFPCHFTDRYYDELLIGLRQDKRIFKYLVKFEDVLYVSAVSFLDFCSVKLSSFLLMTSFSLV